jgi:predicted flap endonuclease-1-like 5' DNA nuclease
MPNRAMDTPADDDDDPMLDGSRDAESEGRDSGIVEVERKASAVTGGVTGALASTLTNATSDLIREGAPRQAGQDIEIDTDLGEGHGPRAQMITQTVVTNGASAAARDTAARDTAARDTVALDDDAIQVSDDEIESAEPARPTLTSGLPAFGDIFSRSRPPPPSLRPRSSSTSLPPPRRSSRAGALLGSSLPPPSFPSLSRSEPRSEPRSDSRSEAPSERNPWLLANKTLELSRANARISTLEDQIAFRDARILTLEERLEAALLKIEELERKRDAGPVAAGPSSAAFSNSGFSNSGFPNSAPASASAASSVARAASKPAIAIPKPADVAKAAAESKAVESKPVPARASNGKGEAVQQAAVQQAAVQRDVVGDSVTPEPPAAASDSIPPEADEDLLTGAAAPPSGPEDVRRITGIGVRFEAALRKQGITRISQIAAWSDADVRQVAKALKIPKSRILKGRWIEAAREMIGSRSTSE